MDKKKVGVYTLILLIGISLTFAYFTGRNITKGDGALTKGTTATAIKNSTVTSKGNIEIDSPDMLPGHKIVSYLEVNATGDNELIPFNIYWEGTNNLITSLNLKVYKSDKSNDELNISANCNKKQKTVSKGIMVYEECSISNIDKLGTAVGEATIETSADTKKVYIAKDQFINSLPDSGETAYYYIVLEYPNENKSQNDDHDQTFNGEVKIEPSDIEADIEMAVYVKQEDGSYKELLSGDIPKDQVLDMKETTCTNGAKPYWNFKTSKLSFSNYTKSGTMCELYFKDKPTAEDTLGNLEIDTSTLSTPNENEFNKTVCDSNTNNNTHTSGSCDSTASGLFKGTDDDGTTYYYRGTVENNWVTFAGKWWRIIRINGNGSIRLIYSGTKKPSDGRWADKTDSQISTSAFNGTVNDNKYVGFMYGGAASGTSGNYTDAHTNTNQSSIKTTLDNWYSKNMTDFTEQLDGSAGFCNDRTPYAGLSATSKLDKDKYGFSNKTTYYGPYIRTMAKYVPSFNCPQSADDLFTMGGDEKGEGNGKLTYPVGLITADEVEFAGGKNANNYGYWLYTGQYYWTMSPSYFNGSYANVFSVDPLNGANANNTSIGVRPVINLKADTKLTYKDKNTAGTIEDPYEVEVN